MSRSDDFEEEFDGAELRKQNEENHAEKNAVSTSTRSQKPPTIQLALADDDSILGLSATQPQQPKKEENTNSQPHQEEKKPAEKPKEMEKPKQEPQRSASPNPSRVSTTVAKDEAADESYPKIEGEKTTGFMVKRGKGESLLGRKSWKSRYFVLNGSSFAYYDSIKDKEPIKTINLHKTDTVEIWNEPPQFLYGFKLCTFKRNLLVAVKSEKAQKKWIERLKIHLKDSPEYTMSEKM